MNTLAIITIIIGVVLIGLSIWYFISESEKPENTSDNDIIDLPFVLLLTSGLLLFWGGILFESYFPKIGHKSKRKK